MKMIIPFRDITKERPKGGQNFLTVMLQAQTLKAKLKTHLPMLKKYYLYITTAKALFHQIVQVSTVSRSIFLRT